MSYYGYLAHHGIKGQKWGVRRYQNEDGTLTEAGRKRYGIDLYNSNKIYSKEAIKASARRYADISEYVGKQLYRDYKNGTHNTDSPEETKKHLNELIIQEYEKGKGKTSAGLEDYERDRYAYEVQTNKNWRTHAIFSGTITGPIVIALSSMKIKKYGKEYSKATNELVAKLKDKPIGEFRID